MGSPGQPPSAPANTVDAKLRGNEFRISLVKAAALSLVSVISLLSLSQLGTGVRFGSGGSKAFLPVSVTSVILAAVMLAVAYQNAAFASAQLDARITAGLLAPKDEVPPDIKKRSDRGWKQV